MSEIAWMLVVVIGVALWATWGQSVLPQPWGAREPREGDDTE